MTNTDAVSDARLRRPADADDPDDRRREARRRRRLDAGRRCGCSTTGSCACRPATVDDPGRDRFLLSKGHGPMAYYAVLAAKGFIPLALARRLRHAPTRRWATTRTGCWSRASRSAPARSGTACRSGSASRWGCAPRAARRRVVVLVGDAELDEGSNHEAIAFAGAAGPGQPHRRRRSTTARPRYGWPGGIAQPLRGRGLGARDVDGRDHDAPRGGLPRHRSPDRPTAVVAVTDGQAMSHRCAMRDRSSAVTSELLDDDPRVAVVLADISADRFARPARRHPDRVINVGIREQLLISVARRAGADRAAADRAHLRAVPRGAAVRAGQARPRPPGRRRGPGQRRAPRTTRRARAGRTRRPRTSRCSTRCPAGRSMSRATPTRSTRCCAPPWRATGPSTSAWRRPSNPVAQATGPHLVVVRRGTGPTIVAVGPMLSPVLDATQDLDVSVLYASTIRPFDGDTLRAIAATPEVILVEPTLAGTSAHAVTRPSTIARRGSCAWAWVAGSCAATASPGSTRAPTVSMPRGSAPRSTPSWRPDTRLHGRGLAPRTARANRPNRDMARAIMGCMRDRADPNVPPSLPRGGLSGTPGDRSRVPAGIDGGGSRAARGAR